MKILNTTLIFGGLILFSCGARDPKMAIAQRTPVDSNSSVDQKLGLENELVFSNQTGIASLYFSPCDICIYKQREFSALLTKKSTLMDKLIEKKQMLKLPEIEFGSYLAKMHQTDGMSDYIPNTCEGLETPELQESCFKFKEKIIERYDLTDPEKVAKRNEEISNLEMQIYEFADSAESEIKQRYREIAPSETLKTLNEQSESTEDFSNYIWAFDFKMTKIFYKKVNNLDKVYIHLTFNKNENFYFENHYDSSDLNSTKNISNVSISLERGIEVLRFSFEDPKGENYNVELFQSQNLVKTLYGKISSSNRSGTIKMIFDPHEGKLFDLF